MAKGLFNQLPATIYPAERKSLLNNSVTVDTKATPGYSPGSDGYLAILGKTLQSISSSLQGDNKYNQNQAEVDIRQQQADQEFQSFLMKNALQKQALLRKPINSIPTPEDQVAGFIKTRELAKQQGLDPNKLSMSIAANGAPSLSMRASEGIGGAALTNARNKKTEQVYNTIYDNYNTNENIDRALNSVGKLESGLKGKVTYATIRNLDANNPLLGDWQNLKMALTDAQLLASTSLKGAISDKENAWLAKAAANDDLISVPRAKAVLDKLSRASNSKEQSLISSYKKVYKEDPYEWEDVKQLRGSKGNNAQGKLSKDNLFDGL